MEQKFARFQQDFREYEATHFIAELVGEADFILNIGPSWGRDFYTLQKQGKTIINCDIAPQHHLPDMLIADVSRGIPFPANSFDAVLMTEVLEHLIEDWVALQEVRRVLKEDGKLICSVPFYHDDPAYHVRVHSPKSIQRLLDASGFNIDQFIYRGGWIRVYRLVHAVRKLMTIFKLNHAWYRFVLNRDRRWGKRPQTAKHATGVYMAAGKKSDSFDWRRVNRETFEHK